MSVHAITAQYSKKLMNVLNEIEALQDSVLGKLVTKVYDLMKKVIGSITTQAWTILGFGLLAGSLSIGAGFVPNQTLQKILGAAGPLVGQQITQVATTFTEAKKTQFKGELDMAKDYSLQHEKGLKEKTSNQHDQFVRHIGQLQDAESQGFPRG